MNIDLLTPLIAFAFASSITPGPNNLMLMASGANFGFRRTLPHIAGVGFGFVFLLAMVGAGLAQVFEQWPQTKTILTGASVVYLLWLAWKTGTAAGITADQAPGTPMTFAQAAAFQWVNPKGWAMALYAITAFAPDGALTGVAFVALVFGAINVPAVSAWTVMGQQMARVLTNPQRRVVFNWTMAALLVGSLYPLLQG